MAEHTGIEWCHRPGTIPATWNPWIGCTHVSEACRHCYMFREQKRYGADPTVVHATGDGTFKAPLRWAEPHTVFVCSWSDFFHPDADDWRGLAWAIMSTARQHTYIILTKRPERIADNLPWKFALIPDEPPWPHVWIGVSVEDQRTADARIPLLLQTPAAVRWVSYEPALGPVDFKGYQPFCWTPIPKSVQRELRQMYPHGLPENSLNAIEGRKKLDWVVVGGESGPDARPMHPAWARSARDQCAAAGVPFFFKQWGEWAPFSTARVNELIDQNPNLPMETPTCLVKQDGRVIRPYCMEDAPGNEMVRLGKKRAGRLLDGHEHNEWPEVRSVTA